MVGRRRAIESPVPGTTRDHVVYKVEVDEIDYLLLDTGGIGGGSTDTDMEDDVARQSMVAIESSDIIVFTINNQEELTASDLTVIDILRKRKRSHVPVLLVATKCDDPDAFEKREPEYRALGIASDMIGISAAHNIGIEELGNAIVEKLKKLHFSKDTSFKPQDTSIPRIAIIGKPNVGKSSLVNALMSDPQREVSERLVSEVPGTTRDSSDTIIRFEDKEYIFIDTAGLRRKARVDEDLEYLSNVKSIQALQDSDVVILLLDATDVISRQDKRIASMAIEAGKGLIIVLNKSDKMEGAARKEKELETRAWLPFCSYAPLLFCSAITREGIVRMFPLIESVARNRLRRIATKELLRWYESAIVRAPSHALSKSKFITQAEDVPPTFVVFLKKPKSVNVSQLRYLENNLRSTFAFEGTPIRWVTKEG